MGAHGSVITLLEDISHDLADNIKFGYGAADNFNSIRDRKYPFIWLDPIRGSFPNRDQVVSDLIEWNISLNFLSLDAKEGNEKETALVWDEMFDLMEKYLHKLDREFLNDETDERIQSGTLTLSSISFQSRRKGTTDLVSGWTLTFTLTTQSDFNYCSIYA